MTSPFGRSLLAVTVTATLGTVPAKAQRAGGNGSDFHGGGAVGPHPGFVGPRPGFGHGFVESHPDFRRGFVEPRVFVRPSFPAGYVGSRS